jgi:hypothetical protein
MTWSPDLYVTGISAAQRLSLHLDNQSLLSMRTGVLTRANNQPTPLDKTSEYEFLNLIYDFPAPISGTISRITYIEIRHLYASGTAADVNFHFRTYIRPAKTTNRSTWTYLAPDTMIDDYTRIGTNSMWVDSGNIFGTVSVGATLDSTEHLALQIRKTAWCDWSGRTVSNGLSCEAGSCIGVLVT